MKDRFFDRIDWAAFWTATVATAAVYFCTLGPSVGLEDSGELATAGAHLGVPHPPGYPFWTLCSWIFCKVFSFVTYMGHPTPAWCISLFSATAGAFAAGFTAMLICRSGRDFVAEDDEVSARNSAILAFGAGVGGALTFSLSPVEWSQSTIVEIYSLNAFFLMWVFLLSYRWMRKPSDKILWVTAFVFGLGLTNYQVLLFAIVPLAIIIAMKDLALFRDVALYLIPVALTYQVLQVGQLFRADRTMQSDAINKHLPLQSALAPNSTMLVLALVLLVAAVVAAVLLKRRGEGERAEKVALFGGGAAAALMFLAALVFRSRVTWAGITAPVAPLVEPTRYALIAAFAVASVVAAVLAALSDEERSTGPKTLRRLGIAAAFAVAAIVAAAMVPQAGDGGYMGVKYPWGKSTAVFWALVIVLFALASTVRKGLCFAIPVAGIQIAAFTLLAHGAMNGLTHPCSWWFGWPIAWNFVLLALCWTTLPHGRSVAGAAFFAQLGVSFYAYMPIVSDLRNPPMNWGYPRTWEGFKHAIMRGQYEAIGFQLPTWEGIENYFKDVLVQFTDLLALLALVPFAVGHWIVRKTNRKAFWQWMIAAASCFLMMSVLLIGLANVKGDVQDGFIQKVKFISSHAMIALWIGYGLFFVSTFVLAKKNLKSQISNLKSQTSGCRLALVLAATMILVAGVLPIVQNYTNDRLVFELGGNEQNGHTFGWQFGAYQLEGANAIREQLVADEEPLPDPEWPEPMEKGSIFFGGTDPGRFVPTYMIYSANFRPDVYLITQNALADDTYMSVERDLYGDEIWIPSKEDSGEAFNIYVDEVQRGVRQANGDLKIENGRVQVTGALGVMEINGILTKMMFDHDRLRHSFYVEESYVIPWMYDYLAPHGLIMKINAEKSAYDAKTAGKDADFWDWYVRRLLKDPMYRRDFAGQKSFSKLRAALAGLYAKKGRYAEAAQAFREAVLLYPASPEATFRYAQEILLPLRRNAIALEMMDYTDLMDPNNRRTASLRDYVTRVERVTSEVARIEKLRRDKKPISKEDYLSLANCYADMGRTKEAAQIATPLIDEFSDLEHIKLILAILIEAKADPAAEKAMQKYLKMVPDGDVLMWGELAKVQARLGKVRESQQSFVRGYKLNGKLLYERMKKDRELYELAAPLFQVKK